ncbi:hypothetical protein D3C87_2211260 [compost metagenome]
MISPTVISPRITRAVPMTRMTIIEIVEAMRLSADASAHQSRTGNCAFRRPDESLPSVSDSALARL